MPSFEIVGVKAATGRKNKRVYHARDKMAASAQAERDGITPQTIVQLPEPGPTERQISYAQDLGIDIPEDVTCAEISDLIDNAIRHRQPADQRARRFANRYGVEYTRYTNKQSIFKRIHHALTPPEKAEELAAWFLFRVHRHLVHGSTETEIQDADHKGLRVVAAHVVQDEKFMDSIRKGYSEDTLIWFGTFKNRQGESFQGASTRTYAYRTAKDAMQRWVTGHEAPALSNRPATYPSRHKPDKAAKTKTSAGATLWAIVLIVIFAWILI